MANTINKVFGERLETILAGQFQQVAEPSTRACTPPIQLGRWCRNGKGPQVSLINQMNEAANAAGLFRSKEYFSFMGKAEAPQESGAGDRARWRWAFHTGPLTHAMRVVAVMVPQKNSGTTTSSYARLDLATSATGSPVVITHNFVHGPSPMGTSSDQFEHWKVLEVNIDDLQPDTTYYASAYDVDYGRLQSMTAYELPSMTENFEGYLPVNVTAQSPIITRYRELQSTLIRPLWRRGASKVLTWTVDVQGTPLTRTSTTPINVIDQASTTITANTPGFTLVMSNKDRLSQTTGVPVKMFAYGSELAAYGGGNSGRVYLRDSGGSNVLTLDKPWVEGAAAQWHSVTGVIPASTAKYDLHFDCGTAGATFNLHAVTIIEYEA